MAQYNIPTPNTLLFRTVAPEHAAAPLPLLDAYAPAALWPRPATLYTLADVTSGPAAAPIAACAVAYDAEVPEAWLDRFAVALPFRGRGLARRLIAETATALRARGVRRLFVRTTGEEGLVRLLLRAGVISDPGSPGHWSPVVKPGEDGPTWSWLVCDL